MIAALLLLSAFASAEPSCEVAEIPAARCDDYQWSKRAAGDLEAAAGVLEKQVAAVEDGSADRAKAVAAAEALFDKHRLVSLTVDRFGPPELRGSQELRRRLNGVAGRLANCRDRLAAVGRGQRQQAVDHALSASQAWLSPAVAGAVVPSIAGSSDPKASVPDPAALARTADVYQKQKSGAARAAAFAHSSKAFASELAEVERISKLHDAGSAETRGDPVGRAALLHGQSGETCAIVAAQEMLLAYKVIAPSGKPWRQEDTLFEEAQKRGFFKGDRKSGGTPYQFVGDLLQSHGLLIAKHVEASDDELAAVVGSGKMVMADLDAWVLWHNKAFSGQTHEVVVTGLERDKKIGEVLGYYVNDSSSFPYYAAGRLVPAKTFLKAWHNRGARFIEAR